MIGSGSESALCFVCTRTIGPNEVFEFWMPYLGTGMILEEVETETD